MRIRSRLLVFALVSVALVFAAGYLGVANGRRVRETQRETVLNSGPVIQQLTTIKFSGLRIISAATNYGLFRLEDPIRNAARMRDEEGDILDATRALTDSLDKTRVVWERAGWDRSEIAQMQQASDRIKALSLGIRSDGGRGPSIVERHQEFDAAERDFVQLLDAITAERRQILMGALHPARRRGDGPFDRQPAAPAAARRRPHRRGRLEHDDRARAQRRAR